jgi:hypothetical protein
LATIIDRDACTDLLGIHACIGCDSVSTFYGQGKIHGS